MKNLFLGCFLCALVSLMPFNQLTLASEIAETSLSDVVNLLEKLKVFSIEDYQRLPKTEQRQVAQLFASLDPGHVIQLYAELQAAREYPGLNQLNRFEADLVARQAAQQLAGRLVSLESAQLKLGLSSADLEVIVDAHAAAIIFRNGDKVYLGIEFTSLPSPSTAGEGLATMMLESEEKLARLARARPDLDFSSLGFEYPSLVAEEVCNGLLKHFEPDHLASQVRTATDGLETVKLNSTAAIQFEQSLRTAHTDLSTLYFVSAMKRKKQLEKSCPGLEVPHLNPNLLRDLTLRYETQVGRINAIQTAAPTVTRAPSARGKLSATNLSGLCPLDVRVLAEQIAGMFEAPLGDFAAHESPKRKSVQDFQNVGSIQACDLSYDVTWNQKKKRFSGTLKSLTRPDLIRPVCFDVTAGQERLVQEYLSARKKSAKLPHFEFESQCR